MGGLSTVPSIFLSLVTHVDLRAHKSFYRSYSFRHKIYLHAVTTWLGTIDRFTHRGRNIWRKTGNCMYTPNVWGQHTMRSFSAHLPRPTTKRMPWHEPKKHARRRLWQKVRVIPNTLFFVPSSNQFNNIIRKWEMRDGTISRRNRQDRLHLHNRLVRVASVAPT